MIQFEWDPAKAKSNLRKHGVAFEDAMIIFNDPYVISEQDRIVDGQLRWQSIGLLRGSLMLMVAHTSEAGDGVEPERVRIISARQANRQERTKYEQNRAKDVG